MMRWAAAAACLVVVAGAVLLVYRPRPANEEFVRARVETSAPPQSTSAPTAQPQTSDLHEEKRGVGRSKQASGPSVASNLELDKNAPAAHREKDENPLSTKARADRDVQPAPSREGVTSAKVATGNMVVARKSQDKLGYQYSAGGPSPNANQQVSQNTADQLKQQNEANVADYKAAPAAPPAPLAGAAPAPASAAKRPTEERTADETASSSAPMKKEVAKAAEPAAADAESQVQVQATGEVASNSTEITTTKNKSLSGARIAQLQHVAAVLWRISQRSRLQFSSDGGHSWRNASLDANVVVRAVSALGTDVWAGGNGGLLVHSVDSGGSWQRVVPSVNGRQLAGDIVRVKFSDPANGSVATSSGEVWTSNDGGRTWNVR